MTPGDPALALRVQGVGPTLVWAHGLTFSMAAEDRFGWFDWPRFPPGFRLVRYDARGHGESPPGTGPADYEWPRLAQDMLAIADRCEAPGFVAGGASMGAATALHAAFLAPQRVRALVLAIPPTAWETRAAQAQLYRRNARVGGLVGGALMARLAVRSPQRLLPGWLAAAQPEATRGGIHAGLSGMKGTTLKPLFLGAARSNLPPREDFRAIAHIPALILAWEGDATHPLETARTLQRLLPRSTLAVASGVRELQEFPRRIAAFLADQSGIC